MCGAVFFCMPLSGNDAATCCRRSYLRQQILPRNSVLRQSRKSERAYKRKRQLPHGAAYFFVARKRRGNLFAVVRICVSKFCRSPPFYGSQENPKGHANGNGNFRMGLHTTSLRGNDAATCLPSFVNLRKQILAEELRFTRVKSFRKGMQTETAISAWGDTTSVRGNDAATCLPSFVNLRKQILAVGSHRPHFCFPVSYIWETATSAWGYTTSVRETTRQLHFYMIKVFPD